MANHHLTVAKATFAASLLRPDVTKIDRSKLPQFHSLLEAATISLWEDAGYFEADVIAEARRVMSDPSTAPELGEKSTTRIITTREAPYIMPATHGDPSLPFYELPAGNLMLHIIPNKTIPMRPHSIRPLQFTPGPADESLANAVRDFLKDVETIDHEFDLLDDPNVTAEVSDMGQVLYRNEAEDLVGDTYFGWSRAFCEKMTARNKQGPQQISIRHRSFPNSGHSHIRRQVRITSIIPHLQPIQLLMASSR
ncbi:hypothetical protein DV737_g1261, partial [Chaetothyriales sp. CBS 132003]